MVGLCVYHHLKRHYLLVLDPALLFVVSFELFNLVFELPHKVLKVNFTLDLFL